MKKVMNENLDLVEILKNCPKGTTLYSSIYGDVTFIKVLAETWIQTKISDGGIASYDKTGKILGLQHPKIALCTLFPSKEQCDWNKFKVPEATVVPVKRFDPKKFKPFDKVLWKGLGEWRASFFSHYLSNDVHEYEIYCTDGHFGRVIPYNDDTKHLVGTTNDCPEYYKWWLDVKQDAKQRPSLAVND